MNKEARDLLRTDQRAKNPSSYSETNYKLHRRGSRKDAFLPRKYQRSFHSPPMVSGRNELLTYGAIIYTRCPGGSAADNARFV